MVQAEQVGVDVSQLPSSMWMRFAGYLSADGLNYLLGFVIYGWLIRILTNHQYGQLSVATNIYQVLMMVTSLGLDLVGPRVFVDAGGNLSVMAQRGQRIRLAVAIGICGPVTGCVSLLYWRSGQPGLSALIVAGFAMVLARAVDVSYLAVALGMPGALGKTRALGLGLYLIALFASKPAIVRTVWIIPILNAIGITIGRLQLVRILRRRTPHARSVQPGPIRTFDIVREGTKAGSGQLLLLMLQTLDVLLLAKYVSGDAVGQYAMVSRLYLFGTAVLTCLLNTFMPELISVADRPEQLAKRFRFFLLASTSIGVLGGIAFWLAAPAACELFGHRQLSVAREVAPCYALVFFVMAVCNPFLSFLPSLRKGGAYVGGIAVAALLLAGVDLVLVPRLGPMGAAVGQLVATAFLAVFSAIVYGRHIRVQHLNRPIELSDTLVETAVPTR